MTTISYSQNFEDVLLNRCFSHIDCGFYIDIGAYHPVHDSVTKFFYDKGWCGVNVEANPELLGEFYLNRIRDINLNLLATNNTDGNEKLHIPINNLGLASNDLNLIRQRFDEKELRIIEVKKTTLNEIILTHNIGTIDFLKIDVEGMELEVLEGLDLNNSRPKIILLEVYSGIRQYEKIEKISLYLSKFDYNLVYEDGINNYYLSNENLQLKKFFKFPVNILDDFMRYSEYCLRNENSDLLRKINSKKKLFDFKKSLNF